MHQTDKMEKVEVRAVLNYLVRRKSPKEIHEDFMETLGNECASHSTVKKLAAEFRRVRESIEDDERSGCRKETTTDVNVEIVHSLVICDRRRNPRDIASEVGISFGAVQSILTDILRMSKVSARWVPRMLTEVGLIFRGIYYLAVRMTLRNLWTELRASGRLGFITLIRNLKSKTCSGIIQGVIMVDYSKEGRTINGAYHAEKLKRLRQEIEEEERKVNSRRSSLAG